MRVLIAAIHGIMTGQTTASWPDHFDAWMWRRHPEVKVLKKEYLAGPFPRWNCLDKNVWLARGLASEMELLLGGTPGRTAVRREDSFPATPAAWARSWTQKRGKGLCRGGREAFAVTTVAAPKDARTPAETDSRLFPPPWFVAHSNGAVIALLTTKRLIARGYRVGGVILTGAACEADIAKNGVREWLDQGQLGAAIAYASEDDAVLAGDPRAEAGAWGKLRAMVWHWLMQPYGCLGRTGWLLNGQTICRSGLSRNAGLQPAISPVFKPQAPEDFHGTESSCALPAENRRSSRLTACVTRWFPGGHGVYFAGEHRRETFEQLLSDILEHQTA